MRTPAAVYRALQGRWNLKRTFSNNEVFVGKARFKPCKNENNALHYKEKGIYHQINGQEIVATQQYIYRINNNQISAYFVDRDTATNTMKTSRLFHTLQFDNQQVEQNPLKANANHLCVADVYNTHYEFISEDEFKIIHTVKGPKKDYNSNAFFKRIKDSPEQTNLSNMNTGKDLITNNPTNKL